MRGLGGSGQWGGLTASPEKISSPLGSTWLNPSCYPTDSDINELASEAAEESDSLIALLGLAPFQLHSGAAAAQAMLPSVASWYGGDEDSDSESISDVDSISEAQQLQDLLDRAADETVERSRKKEAELLNLTSVALALTADDLIKLHSIPDTDAEILDEIVAEEQVNIVLGTKLPPLSVSEPSKPLGRGSAPAATINFDYLVELRRRHQRIQAARGVRIQILDSSKSDRAQAESLRQQLTRKLHLALKEEQDLAVGTGLERGIRWRAPAPGGRGGNVPGLKSALANGNSANAALTATAVAKLAATKHKAAFITAKVPHLAEVVGSPFYGPSASATIGEKKPIFWVG
ncbi:hypothetical protein DFH09DRAFT_1346106 [Mycena vulgaris]|nr:hypothetical protein DFH09DRAFT_1346106 [Mycena vulgaris]